MGKGIKKRMAGYVISTIYLIIILLTMYSHRYINGKVVLTVYLPIWVIGAVATIFSKKVFADTIVISAGVGLGAEYLVHIYNRHRPNMAGGFLNTLILLLGFILGIVLQILSNRKPKTNDSG